MKTGNSMEGKTKRTLCKVINITVIMGYRLPKVSILAKGGRRTKVCDSNL